MNLSRPFLFVLFTVFALSAKAANTIDIVTFNIEGLGNPSTAGYSGTRSQQIAEAASDIISGGGEIYALQEVGGSSALNDLITSLNSQDNQNIWSGGVSQPTASQSLAFVYKTSVVSGVSFQTILTNESSYNFAGRYPYLMTATVSMGSSTKTLSIIDLHLKCCTGTSNANRRDTAMSTLLDELYDNYRNDNVIVLGDLNVASEGGANGEITDWGTYTDRDSDGVNDYFHAAGSVTDEPYVPSNPDSDIDHILISNEIKEAWDAIPSSTRNQYLNTTVSDHSPVKTTIDLALIGLSSSGGSSSSSSSSSSGGSSSELSVSQALVESNGTDVEVIGEIIEGYNRQYALRLGDPSTGQTIIVKLESNQRSTWSPYLNPGLIGTSIKVVGTRDTYSGLPSIEYVSSIEAVSGSSGGSVFGVSDALAESNGTDVTVTGEIESGYNGQHALVLGDLNSNDTIIVKLKSNQRSTWSPYLNPGLAGMVIEVNGTRDTYSNLPSIEYVYSISQVSN